MHVPHDRGQAESPACDDATRSKRPDGGRVARAPRPRVTPQQWAIDALERVAAPTPRVSA